MDTRQEFMLPNEDVAFLNEYGCPWETVRSKGEWVLLHNFSTQNPGYNLPFVTAAIRIPTGYPDSPLDMVYFHPHISRIDNKPINATNATQNINGTLFQRWSRHYSRTHPYDVSKPNLGNHIYTVEDWLHREFDR